VTPSATNEITIGIHPLICWCHFESGDRYRTGSGSDRMRPFKQRMTKSPLRAYFKVELWMRSLRLPVLYQNHFIRALRRITVACCAGSLNAHGSNRILFFHSAFSMGGITATKSSANLRA
jgi:hypothetical protein